jgi:hypothetical protein
MTDSEFREIKIKYEILQRHAGRDTPFNLCPDEKALLAKWAGLDTMGMLISEVEDLRAALHELCEVKIIKDVQGDVPWYRERREPAWNRAFSFFSEYRKD